MQFVQFIKDFVQFCGKQRLCKKSYEAPSALCATIYIHLLIFVFLAASIFSSVWFALGTLTQVMTSQKYLFRYLYTFMIKSTADLDNHIFLFTFSLNGIWKQVLSFLLRRWKLISRFLGQNIFLGLQTMDRFIQSTPPTYHWSISI